jgi:hypothetical protein
LRALSLAQPGSWKNGQLPHPHPDQESPVELPAICSM